MRGREQLRCNEWSIVEGRGSRASGSKGVAPNGLAEVTPPLRGLPPHNSKPIANRRHGRLETCATFCDTTVSTPTTVARHQHQSVAVAALALPGFAQAEDVRAIRRKRLFAMARVKVRAFHFGADDFQKIGVGPVVTLEQWPQRDHGTVDVGIVPHCGTVAACRVGIQTFRQRGEFRRVGKTFGDIAKVRVPRCFLRFSGDTVKALEQADAGQLALVRIGIETGGRQLPERVGLQVHDAVDPIADAHQRGHRIFPDLVHLIPVARAAVFDKVTIQSLAHDVGIRVLVFGQAKNVGGEVAHIQGFELVRFGGCAATGHARVLANILASGGFGENAPGLAGLQGARARFFFLGVFGNGAVHDCAQPRLDGERGEIKMILLEPAKLQGVLDSVHGRQDKTRVGRGSVGCVETVFVRILIFHADHFAKVTWTKAVQVKINRGSTVKRLNPCDVVVWECGCGKASNDSDETCERDGI